MDVSNTNRAGSTAATSTSSSVIIAEEPIFHQTIEPTKDTHKGSWVIKDFVALWEVRTQQGSGLNYKFEIGNSIQRATQFQIALGRSEIDAEYDFPHDDYPCRNQHVALYFAKSHLHGRPTFVTYSIKILRTDKTLFREVSQKIPMDIASDHFSGYSVNLATMAELMKGDNAILGDGVLNLRIKKNVIGKQTIQPYPKPNQKDKDVQKKKKWPTSAHMIN